MLFFFFSSRRRHTRSLCDWSSDVCSSDLRHDRCRRQHRRTAGCDQRATLASAEQGRAESRWGAEPGILAEDSRLQLTQSGARLKSALLEQGPAGFPVDVEGLRLATAAVQ